MTDQKLGSRKCYICDNWMPPLVSACPSCGYSQLPAPEEGGPASAEKTHKDTRSKIKSEIEKARADLQSRIKKKK